MHLPLEKPGNYSNGCQTTSWWSMLLVCAEVSKVIVDGVGEVVCMEEREGGFFKRQTKTALL